MPEPNDNLQRGLFEDAAAGGRTIVIGLKSFLGWLATSIAGISAVLYAFGFLVTRAHLNMLGLYGFIDYGPEAYLQEGARFFLVTGYEVLRGSAVPLLSILVSIAALLFALQPLLTKTRIAAWMRRRADAVWLALLRLGERRALSAADVRDLLRRILFVGLLLWALDGAGDTLAAAVTPLCVANLLYANPTLDRCSSTATLRDSSSTMQTKLLEADSKALAHSFYDIFYRGVFFIIVTFLAWRVAQPWRSRAWFMSPFVVTALIFLILLPMDYGILQAPVSYPRVELAPGAKHSEGATTLYLMSKTGSEFVLWDGSAKQLLWIPASGLTGAQIKDVENLFGRPVPSATDKGTTR
jgi:hypothetical protein